MPSLCRSWKAHGVACTTRTTDRDFEQPQDQAELNIGKTELFKDLDKAVEFDQSRSSRRSTKKSTARSAAIRSARWSETMSSAVIHRTSRCSKRCRVWPPQSHAPFIAAATPAMFNFEGYTELAGPRDLERSSTTKHT